MNFIKLMSLGLIFLNSSFFLKGVHSDNKGMNLLVMLKYLDINTLSRLVAFKQYIDPTKYELRPNFGNGWLYHVKLLDRWTRRFGMYGYGIASLNSYGNSNCMFNTIHTIFHLNNITNEVLLEKLNTDLEPAVEAAIRGLLQSEKSIKPLNLKRISQIAWLGADPYDKESASLFQLEPLLKRMEPLISLQEAYGAQGLAADAGTMFQGVDMITYYNRLTNERKKIPILKEMWDEFEEKRYDRFGDHNDKMYIEYVFEMLIIYLGKTSTAIVCGLHEFDFTPKFVILTVYDNGRHYDVAGLYKLGTQDEKDIKTMYKTEEIPLPLLFFITEDCRIRPN